MKQHHASGWPRFATPAAITKLSSLKIPTLILTGSSDLPEVLLVNEHLAKNIPNAKHIIIDGVAHMINMEKPQRFNEEVKKFLAEK
jgi:pimeloyl-ACP methyl ester carboxylesterase